MRKLIVIKIVASLLLLSGCADTQQYLQSPQGQAVLAGSEVVASVAVNAAATYYGGPMAGQLASAGLDALGTVMEGYINKPLPNSIAKASPGISAIGTAVAPLVSSTKPVTQADVNVVYKAAKIAKGKKAK